MRENCDVHSNSFGQNPMMNCRKTSDSSYDFDIDT